MATRKDTRGTSEFVVQAPSSPFKLATIDHIDTDLNIAYVKIRDRTFGSPQLVPAQLPIPFLSSGGGFIGGYIAGGTPVYIGQVEGGANYFIAGFAAQDPSPKNSLKAANIVVPPLVKGQMVLQANTAESITFSSDNGITIGNYDNSLVFDPTRNVLVNTFDNEYNLTEAARSIDGTIKRDRTPSSVFSGSLRYADASYDDSLIVIGMDPIYGTNNSNIGASIRNPARVEKHEIVYEYEQFANIQNNAAELKNYNPNAPSDTTNIIPPAINRRESRADALSLSLVSPNYLMESIKGTVVDVFGNVLDINRNIIPIGQTSNLSATTIKTTAADGNTFNNTYEQIKRVERKSIAYHFEVNARKETKGSGVPPVTDFSDYARQRSRFHFDIDKEGLFKLNVPASSETGNVPLLTRYENYSTVNVDTASNNPDALVFNQDYKDVLIESFINTSNTSSPGAPIKLVDEFGNPSAPMDRFYGLTPGHNQYVGHGTAYHDISKTCISFQTGFPSNPTIEYFPITNIALGRITPLPQIVSPTIITTGANANAGGRSGQMNFDGSIEVNIGANTVDNQSLWLDTEGGVVAAVGMDSQNISLAGKLDGQLLLEIGGASTNPSSKALVAGAFDIRVYDGSGGIAMLRIDKEGLTVSTPGRIVFSANQDIMIHSNSTLRLEGDSVFVQSREIVKDANKGQI